MTIRQALYTFCCLDGGRYDEHFLLRLILHRSFLDRTDDLRASRSSCQKPELSLRLECKVHLRLISRQATYSASHNHTASRTCSLLLLNRPSHLRPHHHWQLKWVREGSTRTPTTRLQDTLPIERTKTPKRRNMRRPSCQITGCPVRARTMPHGLR